ncbi:MAG: hypothetical protein HY540_07145 [Deltaproteobacteria bacterium]|nr:hypothetical protein [Deltaproteobacteria bacterium]
MAGTTGKIGGTGTSSVAAEAQGTPEHLEDLAPQIVGDDPLLKGEELAQCKASSQCTLPWNPGTWERSPTCSQPCP